MTQQAAALQTYNNELVKCIEDLCSKREELSRQITQEDEEKERLQRDIRVLSEKLSRVNESLAQKLSARATFDRTIAETEAAYTKADDEVALPPFDPGEFPVSPQRPEAGGWKPQ
ncbi:putative Sjoegren syndrome nuclear autoantigen 1 isoform 2 [Scophthalmus maximus]|uniref:Putative Sjoegren syndrome nuclear autoantigen 1 isoform 2 n=1 Tax=Scophthalmus maximus TaxID=52904 RepID=A0A2U9CGU8_SCOMX|nr:putative Sjoegren syndrome nuclear autoantigen 1 isoform 2 [Scophthalmus maximus]